MTEGIIQKVFDKFITLEEIREHTFCLDIDDLEILKQELIAEIEKECAHVGLHNHWIDMKTLIGNGEKK